MSEGPTCRPEATGAQTAASMYRRGRTQSRWGCGDHRKQGPQKDNLTEKRKTKETSVRY